MNAVELIWSKQAREDLLDLYVSIGLEQPSAAEDLFDKIEAKVTGLIRFPRLGPRRPEIRPATRILIQGPFLILYETHPDTDLGPVRSVQIVRVLDGRRDLARLF